MKANVVYACEKCGKEFKTEIECFIHEKQCGIVRQYTCDKCGKIIEYDENSYDNKPHWNIDLGRAGYNSQLDGSDINFTLCDDCLNELIESFTWQGKAKIHNSGCNTYGSNEDWIRLHKGEMPEEEQIEKGYGWY